MDQQHALQSLGERIVKTTRLAVALHLAADDFESPLRRQQGLIGGTDLTVRRVRDGCGHAESSDIHTVTDDTLPSGRPGF